MYEFPPLNKRTRKREFSLYSDQERASVVYYWLFSRKGFRELDTLCLGLDGRQSHGWQSMGIAHYLGLDGTHHGFFEGALPSYALNTLLAHQREDQSFALIYCYLRDWFIAHPQSGNLTEELVKEKDPDYHTDHVEASYWIRETLLAKAPQASIDQKLLSLLSVNTSDQTIKLGSKRYFYSKGALKQAVKCLYDFQCQICGTRIYRPGWIKTLSREEQWGYLNADAHHIQPLSQEGPDSLANLLCLCPSCHRRFHTRQFTLLEHNRRIGCEDQVLHTSWEILAKHPIVIGTTDH
ncbi:MAG TPA: hypothetical protein DCR02_00940 [Sphaerochaeta sp.]|nr:hypothetical protein [Sphaerochaeta sp.]